MSIRNAILSLCGLCLCLGFLSEARAQTAKLNFNSLIAGSQFLAPATFQLSVYALPAAGKIIQKVEFLNGNTVIGEATLSSMANIYVLDVPGQGVGSYTIKAKSTDNTGATKTTGTVTVTVREGKVYGAPGAFTPVPLYTTSAPYGYNEYLPKGYDENDAVKKWPLVIDLHGKGGIPGIDTVTKQVHIDQLDAAMDGPYTNIKMDGINLPAVLLHPQSGPSPDEWDHADLNSFIDYALIQYNIDPDRVYLTGQSHGSNIGALEYAGGGTNTNPNAKRLAALFPMCGGSFNSTKAKGARMAHVPMWIFSSWGDSVGGSIGGINAVNYAAGATPYKDVTSPDVVVTLPDLLYSFASVAGGEEVDKIGSPSIATTPLFLPPFIPVENETINKTLTVSYVDNAWSWAEGYQRHPNSRIMQTLLSSFRHTIWNTTHGLGELWTWVFLQSRAPAARSIFTAERFNTTRALVTKAYTDTLTLSVTAPRGATFTRAITGPAWLKVAADGTLSGTPGIADLGINTWDITVTTTTSTNAPITETSELIIFVEAPGYNDWWQKRSIPAINADGSAILDNKDKPIEIQLGSGPAGDDDGDGLTNFFEFVTGSNPQLHTSDTRNPNPVNATTGLQDSVVPSFNVSVEAVPGNPAQLQITYGPLIKGLTYTVKSTGSLSSGTWTSENTFAPTSDMAEKVLTLTSASTPSRFYTVEITKP